MASAVCIVANHRRYHMVCQDPLPKDCPVAKFVWPTSKHETFAQDMLGRFYALTKKDRIFYKDQLWFSKEACTNVHGLPIVYLWAECWPSDTLHHMHQSLWSPELYDASCTDFKGPDWDLTLQNATYKELTVAASIVQNICQSIAPLIPVIVERRFSMRGVQIATSPKTTMTGFLIPKDLLATMHNMLDLHYAPECLQVRMTQNINIFTIMVTNLEAQLNTKGKQQLALLREVLPTAPMCVLESLLMDFLDRSEVEHMDMFFGVDHSDAFKALRNAPPVMGPIYNVLCVKFEAHQLLPLMAACIKFGALHKE